MPARSVIYVLVDNGTNVITGVEKEAGFNVYPNPSANEIVVDIPAGSYNKLSVLDQSGRTIIERTIGTEKVVRLSHRLSKGLYHIRLSGADKTLHAKVVVE
jgi:hypothetical protein